MSEQAIRDALAKGPAPGEWQAHREYSSWVVRNGELARNGLSKRLAGIGSPGRSRNSPVETINRVNAQYIAACNPSAIAALLAELDATRARVRELEGDAQKLRNGNTALLEALMDMVLQHCCSEPEDLIRHGYLSSNEAAVEILDEAGMIENDRLNWPALQARKPAMQAGKDDTTGGSNANGT